MVARGLILQPTYRIENERPVVHLFGKLDSGKTFLVRDDRQRPHFFIPRGADARARALGATSLLPTPRVDLGGAKLLRVEAPKPSDVPPLRDRLVGAGIECLEADVRFALRPLIDRQIRSAVAIHGQPVEGAGVDLVFHNPDLEPAIARPALTILSIDIETDPYRNRLLSAALSGCGTEEVMVVDPEMPAGPGLGTSYRSEADLLRQLCVRIRELDPDIITGWNVIGFDLHFLVQRSRAVGVRLEIGRAPGDVRLFVPREGSGGRDRAAEQATIPGRVVLDGVRLLRGAFIRMESYSLDSVSNKVLGEGKTIHGSDRVGEILRTYREERAAFVEYNLKDARLVLDILDKLDLVTLSLERSLLTGMPLDRVSAAIASFDFLYLSELSRRGRTAPSVGAGTFESDDFGGTVLQPDAGVYDNVLVFDYKSLYPSIIRTFEIDPLGYLGSDLLPSGEGAQSDEVVVAPNGAIFRKQKGILSDLLDGLFVKREDAKERGDAVSSQAIKILMNSFYGVLGTPVCRFYNPKLAAAITSFGREILMWAKGVVQDKGLDVLYGDTDSLFVRSAESTPEAAHELGRHLAEDLNRRLVAHVHDTWGVTSRLELEFERLYLRILFPRKRHGEGGAMKHYVGLTEDNGVVFTGMEVVRRDWTDLARQMQKELYERFFHDRPFEDYLCSTVDAVRTGQLDEQLVYRKALRKDLREYTATTPPHVAAARKMKGPPGTLIDYVITSDGPEPARERKSPFDYEHYVDKQIRPITTPLLDLLGLKFEKVIGDDTQLELW
ncbi:MAG: DNA polymerase II [Acidobacteriota bacterium]|nr:DNA polymerase II [Acidobacteriota bacterium]